MRPCPMTSAVPGSQETPKIGQLTPLTLLTISLNLTPSSLANDEAPGQSHSLVTIWIRKTRHGRARHAPPELRDSREPRERLTHGFPASSGAPTLRGVMNRISAYEAAAVNLDALLGEHLQSDAVLACLAEEVIDDLEARFAALRS